MLLAVEGLALYVRAISRADHGTPKEFAKRCADHGLRWVALAGPWHELRDGVVRTGLMNKPETIQRYADALWARDIDPFVWGYPWQGTEEVFADQMDACAGEYNLALLDPELGSNPTRSSKGAGKAKADLHAATLVELMAERFDGGIVGLSTFGSGVRMGWFPLYAFARALAQHFPGRTFVGGQTYTDDARVDPSIADFVTAIEKVADLDTIQLVPNYGTYKWVPRDPSKPVSSKNRKAVSKTPEELYWHLAEFIDEAEPVGAMIGWAENFVTRAQWPVLARFADQLARGACALPKSR